jgi:hypothetical protein
MIEVSNSSDLDRPARPALNLVGVAIQNSPGTATDSA